MWEIQYIEKIFLTWVSPFDIKIAVRESTSWKTASIIMLQQSMDILHIVCSCGLSFHEISFPSCTVFSSVSGCRLSSIYLTFIRIYIFFFLQDCNRCVILFSKENQMWVIGIGCVWLWWGERSGQANSSILNHIN